MQWDCGPCTLPGKEFAAQATNIFVSTILRKLDLGVSSVSSNQPAIMGPVSRFPKAFQNSKEHPTPPCAPGWHAAVNLIQIRIVRM